MMHDDSLIAFFHYDSHNPSLGFPFGLSTSELLISAESSTSASDSHSFSWSDRVHSVEYSKVQRHVYISVYLYCNVYECTQVRCMHAPRKSGLSPHQYGCTRPCFTHRSYYVLILPLLPSLSNAFSHSMFSHSTACCLHSGVHWEAVHEYNNSLYDTSISMHSIT